MGNSIRNMFILLLIVIILYLNTFKGHLIEKIEHPDGYEVKFNEETQTIIETKTEDYELNLNDIINEQKKSQ